MVCRRLAPLFDANDRFWRHVYAGSAEPLTVFTGPRSEVGRNAAELAVAEAVEALTAALDELLRHGFELQQIAQLFGC